MSTNPDKDKPATGAADAPVELPPVEYYRGRRPVNLIGCLEITSTGISRTKWEGSSQTSAGGSVEVCGPTTVERVVRYAVELALSLRLPFEDPVVQHRVTSARERRDAFVRDVVEQASLQLQRAAASLPPACEVPHAPVAEQPERPPPLDPFNRGEK